MYKIFYSSRMERDMDLMCRRGKSLKKLENILNLLAAGKSLPPKFRDHELSGKYRGVRECHIEPDWLLMYQILKDKLIVYALRTGTHSDLF